MKISKLSINGLLIIAEIVILVLTSSYYNIGLSIIAYTIMLLLSLVSLILEMFFNNEKMQKIFHILYLLFIGLMTHTCLLWMIMFGRREGRDLSMYNASATCVAISFLVLVFDIVLSTEKGKFKSEKWFNIVNVLATLIMLIVLFALGYFSRPSIYMIMYLIPLLLLFIYSFINIFIGLGWRFFFPMYFFWGMIIMNPIYLAIVGISTGSGFGNIGFLVEMFVLLGLFVFRFVFDLKYLNCNKELEN